MAEPKNLEELIAGLAKVWDMVERDPRREGQAKEMSNAAGKMINAAKLHVVVAVAKGKEPSLPFLGDYSNLKALKGGAQLLLKSGE